MNHDDADFSDSGSFGPVEQLDIGSAGMSARTRVAFGLSVAVVAGLTGWRIATEHPGHSSVSAPSATVGATSAVAGSASAGPASCPAGDQCRVTGSLPATVTQAVRVHLPATRLAPAGHSTVLDLTTRTLVYRRITVTGNSFKLIVWVSPVEDAQPSDTDAFVPAGYHVKSLCSGPPRDCPASSTLRALALDPRLVSIS